MSSLNNRLFLYKLITYNLSNKTILNLMTLNKNIYNIIFDFPLFYNHYETSIKKFNKFLRKRPNWKFKIYPDWKNKLNCCNNINKFKPNIYRITLSDIDTLIDLELLSDIHDVVIERNCKKIINFEKIKNVKYLYVTDSIDFSDFKKINIPELNTLVIHDINMNEKILIAVMNNFKNLLCVINDYDLFNFNTFNNETLYFHMGRYGYWSKKNILVNKLNLPKNVKSICDCHGVKC